MDPFFQHREGQIMRSVRFFRLFVFLIVLFELAMPVSSAHAWNTTINTCNEQALLDALPFGGEITFGLDCYIALSKTITLNDSTTIDGGTHHVVIDGGLAMRVFYISYSWLNYATPQKLKNLTIQGGYDRDGGGIYVDNSNTTLENVTLYQNIATNNGGAIYIKNGAAANVTNSSLDYNGANSFGGAIINYGTLTVSGSSFTTNCATTDGGAIFIGGGGTATITNSIFSENKVIDWSGGAIFIDSGGTANINKSTFSYNKVDNLTDGFGGGGIFNVGTANVNNSIFSNNSAHWGGAILTFSSITVSNSTFSENNSFYGGGISVYQGATANVSSSTFFGNTAADGGGIFINQGGTANVSSSTFSGNYATAGGSGIYNFHNNYGSGIVHLGNTIIANSESTNCYGAISDTGGNLSTDQSCPAIIYANPLLGLLQNNGGPTFTMALPPNSPAIDKGEKSLCLATSDKDQRGQPRFVDGDRDEVADCDIGAFEIAPTWTYLPVLMK
jgi:hypothetical protein